MPGLAPGQVPDAARFATRRLRILAALAGVLDAFNENPKTDAKDGEYRLYTMTKVSFCCNGDKLEDFNVDKHDKQGGLEITIPNPISPLLPDFEIKGTINMTDPVNVTRIDDSTVEVDWDEWGRPNVLVEPGMQWVGFRTSTKIWHRQKIRYTCKGNKGYHNGN